MRSAGDGPAIPRAMTVREERVNRPASHEWPQQPPQITHAGGIDLVRVLFCFSQLAVPAKDLCALPQVDGSMTTHRHNHDPARRASRVCSEKCIGNAHSEPR